MTPAGRTLHLFAGDSRSGDTNRQGFDAFGAAWLALSAAGNAVTTQPPATGGGGGAYEVASAVRDLAALQAISAQLLRMTIVEPSVDVDHVARGEQRDDVLVDHVDLILDCVDPLLVEHASSNRSVGSQFDRRSPLDQARPAIDRSSDRNSLRYASTGSGNDAAIRVPPVGGLSITRCPPSDVTRSAIPTRPWPLASAPPIPSSEISTRSAPSATLVRTAARVREKDAVTRRWQPRMGNDERALGVAD